MDPPPQPASKTKKRGGFRTMVIITDECIECGSCIEVCPEEAIQEGDGKHIIDQELCIECLSCLDECPNEAIIEQ
jgi:NAD-dependent dihydropyrimidine dehydrogenase PreA subunit